MSFPNWFRIGWWAFMTVVLAGFLARRLGDLLAGKGTAFDNFALILFVCLSLAPIFAEISLLGVTLKQKLDALDKKVEAVKAELHNTLSVQSHFNPSISIVAPRTTDYLNWRLR